MDKETDKKTPAENSPEDQTVSDSGGFAEVTEKPGLRRAALAAVIVAAAVLVAALSFGVYAYTSGRNGGTESRAQAFAEKLTDTLQSKGQERVEEQFWNGYTYKTAAKKTSVFDGLLFDITDSYDRYGPADSKFGIIGKKAGAKMPGNGDTQRYAILGTEYKGTKYDVWISYDPSAYGDDVGKDGKSYNVNSFPDANALSDSSTAVINPEGMYVEYETDENGSYIYDDTSCSFKSKNKTMETAALDEFFSRYTNFYQEAVNLVNSAFDEAGIDSSHRLSGRSFYSTSQKAGREAEMQKQISRETVILAQGEEGDIDVRSSVLFKLTDPSLLGDPQAVISAVPTVLAGATVKTEAAADSDSHYELNPDGNAANAAAGTADAQAGGQSLTPSAEASADGSTTTVYEPITQAQIDALSSTLSTQINALWSTVSSDQGLTVQYPVFENDSAYDKLDNIYLMYCPLRNSDWKSDTVNIDISGISDQYSASKKLNLYVVPQLGLLSAKKTSYNTLQGADYIAPKLSGGRVTYGVPEDTAAQAVSDSDYGETVTVENEGTLFDMTRIKVNYLKGWMRTLAAADMNDSIVADSGSQDIVYKLNVKVYRAADGKFSGRYLASRSVTCS